MKLRRLIGVTFATMLMACASHAQSLVIGSGGPGAGVIGSPVVYDDATLVDDWVFEQDAAKGPAADKPSTAPPTLSDVDKLKIDNLAKRIEIAQLRAQAAQADFEKARGEIAQLVQSLQKDGYDLNLQTMEYTKKPDPKPAPK